MKIGIVGPRDSVENIVEKLLKINRSIKYKLYIKEEVSDVTDIIDICQKEMDALILTGDGINHFFHSKGKIDIPTTYIHRKNTSLFLALWNIKNDFNLVPSFSLDVVTEEVLDEVASELHLENATYPNPYSPHYSEEDYIKWHIKLYDKGKTKIMITGFGAVYSRLKNLGYSVYRLYPTYTQVKLAYNELLNKATISKLKSTQVAIQIIRIKHEGNLNYYEELEMRNAIETNILSYVRSVQGALYSTGRNEYTLFGTRGTFEANFSDFFKLLVNSNKLLHSGIGYGSTVFQADLHARKAINAALEEDKFFIIDETGSFYGPITEKTFKDRTSIETIKEITETCGISPDYLSKIKELITRKENPTLDAKEVAAYLNISDRSVRRIFIKLGEHGYGKIKDQTSHSKGRPKKVIEINF